MCCALRMKLSKVDNTVTMAKHDYILWDSVHGENKQASFLYNVRETLFW